jgi:hypothetical protein
MKSISAGGSAIPVLGSDFHEVDLGWRVGHQLVHQRTAQAQACTANRVLVVSLCHSVAFILLAFRIA